MTAKGFEYYGQSVATMVTPTAPAPQAAAAPQTRTVTRGANRLMTLGVYLAVWAGLSLLEALLVTVTPLGAINLDITQPFLATVVVVVMLTIIAVARA